MRGGVLFEVVGWDRPVVEDRAAGQMYTAVVRLCTIEVLLIPISRDLTRIRSSRLLLSVLVTRKKGEKVTRGF